MTQLNVFPENSVQTTRLMFVNFGKTEELYSLRLLKTLRSMDISAEIYPEAAKIKKQMAYADSKAIPFVAIAGEKEIAGHCVGLKNMLTGEQENVSPEDLPEKIR
jgi:histidyl-tRNA synthetase